GSCPKITTSTLSKGVSSNAWKINLGGGYTVALLYSFFTKSANSAKYGFSNSSLRASFREDSIFTSIKWCGPRQNRTAVSSMRMTHLTTGPWALALSGCWESNPVCTHPKRAYCHHTPPRLPQY